MEDDWRNVVKDEQEIAVFKALEDTRWDWRTLHALSKASGLGREQVRKILAKYPSWVKKSIMTGPDGQDLYTLRQRYFERRGFWYTGTSGTSST